MKPDIYTLDGLCALHESIWNDDDGLREQREELLTTEFNNSFEFRKLCAEVLRTRYGSQCSLERVLEMLWRVPEPRVKVYDATVLSALQYLRQQESIGERYCWAILASIANLFLNSTSPIKFSTLRIIEWGDKLTFCEGVLRVHWHYPVPAWTLATVLDLLDEMVLNLDRKRTRTIGDTIEVYQSKFSSYEPYESHYTNLAKFARYYNENRITL